MSVVVDSYESACIHAQSKMFIILTIFIDQTSTFFIEMFL